MSRSARIFSGVAVFGVVIFVAAFVLQHAGVLADAHNRRHVDPPARHLVPSRGAGQALLVAPLTAASVQDAVVPRFGATLFAPRFAAGTGLVTNDFAYFNPDNPTAVTSRDWIVTSGSLFATHGVGWTGIPDSATPNAGSTNGTGSATFRLVTRGRDFGNVAVSFDLLTKRFVRTHLNPIHDWDGVHVFVHYRSEHSLYVVTVNRRDNLVLVKKKRPGGTTNGGTYYTLGTPVAYRPPIGRWQHVLVTIAANPNHTVSIAVYLNGHRVLVAVDTGIGGDALTQPGAVGIRGDNTEFEFANFRVRALSGSPGSPSQPARARRTPRRSHFPRLRAGARAAPRSRPPAHGHRRPACTGSCAARRPGSSVRQTRRARQARRGSRPSAARH